MDRLLFEILPWLLLGMVLGWKWPWLSGWLVPSLVRWGVPLSLATLLLRSNWSFSLWRVGLVALLVPLLSLGVLFVLAPFCKRLKDPVLILGAAVGNTGYWGLPVALALLPPQAIPTAAVYDVVGTLITWCVGPLVLGMAGPETPFLNTLLASPALQGLMLSILISHSPWKDALVQVLWWPARGVFLLALGVLGMRLGVTLKNKIFLYCEGLPLALTVKLLLIPLLVWFISTVLALPLMDRQALVLQGAAPTALSVLLIAETHQESGSIASSLVISSTFSAMVTVPLWWCMLR